MWARCAYLSAGAAVGAVLLAGCGGSSSAPVTNVGGASGASGPSGSAALSKPEFIKQADAVCAEANTAISDLTSGATTADRSTQVSQELEIVRSELQSLQALKPPSGDRSTLDDFVAALKNEVDALERENSALAAGADTTAAESELASARANAEAAATEYGMKGCGNAKARPTQAGTTTTAPTAPTTTTAVPTTTVPTTTSALPTTTTPTTTAVPAPAPTGGTGGGTGSGTAGGTGGGIGSGGTGGSGGVSP
jgi:hypothetical protein